ncbi:MAG: hypothetical protein L0G99_18395, partial [Propionibacteriales bacterium]|nr:hypothetical protein [Propionibacteriales bacterium]
AVAGVVALVLPGARYTQHTPFGDLQARLSAGGALFVGVGTEDDLRGILDPLIPTFVLGLWFALVVGIAVTGLRYRHGTGLTGFVVSAVSVGVAATQFWSLVSMVLQMNPEGAGWPEPGLAVVFSCLALCCAATVMWWRHLRSSLLDF